MSNILDVISNRYTDYSHLRFFTDAKKDFGLTSLTTRSRSRLSSIPLEAGNDISPKMTPGDQFLPVFFKHRHSLRIGNLPKDQEALVYETIKSR